MSTILQPAHQRLTPRQSEIFELIGAGKSTKEIAIRLERREQHWAIVVDDNGPGLPDDHTGDMPLYSSKPSGSGLGLFIVRSAMEGHNGALTLGVSPSGGTRAVLLLPTQD